LPFSFVYKEIKMPWKTNSDLPDSVKSNLPSEAQSQFREVANSVLSSGGSEESAMRQAWGVVKRKWKKGTNGKWIKKSYVSLEMQSEIKKTDEDERLVFGWFSIVEKGGESIVDDEGDFIEPSDLEKSAYDFVLNARLQGDRHVRKGVGHLVESMVFTKEKQALLGIDLGMVGWWGGFKVNDEEFGKHKKKEPIPPSLLEGMESGGGR
jgi:cation transport regulator